MRFHRHDIRDLKLAFALGFDLRRVSRAAVALAWTVAVLVAAVAYCTWSHDGRLFSAEGLAHVMDRDGLPGMPIPALAVIAAGWWLVFSYLIAPILRSVAFDIARDEQQRTSSIPALNRQAALAPFLALAIPAISFGVILLWALTSLIPGVAGDVIALIGLPFALMFAVIGALVLLPALFALPLMAPAAVTEGSDYFEAASRPIGYVMQRPGTYVMYMLGKCFVTLVAALVGALAVLVTAGFVAGGLLVVGQDALVGDVLALITPGSGMEPASVSLLTVVLAWSVLALVVVYLSWLMVVALAGDQLVYLLMRYRVDGVPFSAITVAEEKLALPNAIETAEQAEEARKRYDAQQAKDAVEEQA